MKGSVKTRCPQASNVWTRSSGFLGILITIFGSVLFMIGLSFVITEIVAALSACCFLL